MKIWGQANSLHIINILHYIVIKKYTHLFNTRGSENRKLRRQFKSTNKYDYQNVDLEKKIKPNYFLYENSMVLHLKKLEFPSPKDALCQIWLKLAQRFWKRRFLNFVNVFSLFRNYLH